MPKPVVKTIKKEKSQAAIDNPDEGRMIYVGGLCMGVFWQELKDHMKQVGTIEFVEVIQDEWGKSKGTGFVRYSTEEEAQAAIEQLNGTEISSKDGSRSATIEVDLWTGPKPRTHHGGQGAKGMKGMGKMGIKGMGNQKGGMFLTFQQIQSLINGGGGGGGKGMMGGKGGMMMAGAGRTRAANLASGKKIEEPAKKVRVIGLPDGVKWQELKDHFKQVGTVEFSNVNKLSPGNCEGEVRFTTAGMAKKAIAQLNGSMIGDEGPIEVEAWE